MTQEVLYRKYRPQKFSEVVGQDHVIDVLQAALKNGGTAHAYLFAGSRGTGKTSVARIFAREIGTSQNDLYEIDAASNRGIDDIRAIREAVNAQPFESPYKVYIIDEVHMLTKEAFNALLKTLEEPPKHAIFILATTELDKLPETIISRCQVFTFKKPTQKILKDVVLKTAKAEGFILEPAAAELIALLGDGSFRDAMGTLQKVVGGLEGGKSGAGSVAGKKVSLEDVATITGSPRGAMVNDFVTALAKKDIGLGLRALQQAVEANVDMKVYITMVLERVRAVLLLRMAPNFVATLKGELSETDFVFAENLSKDATSSIAGATIVALLDAQQQMGYATIAQLPLELALIKLVGQNT
ncbi:TPA: DNA polymerase III, subunit gamma and tau [Candidatus Taylorbacteria bacterium]|nr:DNA polymerase III, subunit gamma and tau [Candidatus Taylorbacteria bacterium]